MKKQHFKVDQKSTDIYYWHECDKSIGFELNTYSHLKLFHGIIRLMKKRGWKIGVDESIKTKYTSLSKYHKYGKKGDLEVKLKIYTNGFKLEFYQNIVFENSSGGYYDFDKFKKMPYLIQLQFRLIARAIKTYFEKHKVPNKSKPINPSAIELILEDQRRNTHIHGGATSLAEIGDYIENDKKRYQEQSWSPNTNYLDANKQDLKCGQTKYFYSYKHGNRLVRGTIYHNINNMWWVICNGIRCNVAAFELMDFCPFLVGRKPLSDKELLARLKRKRSQLEAINDYKSCLSIQAKIEQIAA